MKVPLEKFENWLIEKNLKDRTVKEYLHYFNKFSVGFPSLNQENVSRFLADKGNRNSVARSFLLNFKKFLVVNYRELGFDIDTRLEISEIELPKVTGRIKERIIKPLTEDQILLLEKHLSQEKEKIQLLLSFYCGLRVGELFKIQVSSFNWDEWKKNPEEMGECRVYGKGDKEGIALIPSDLMKRVARYIRSKSGISISSYIFLRNVTSLQNINIPNRATTWNKNLLKAGIESGITKKDEEGKIIQDTRVHPHKLRHSFGHYLKTIKKTDIRNIKEFLRHASIVSTQRYTYTDKSELKEIMKS